MPTPLRLLMTALPRGTTRNPIVQARPVMVDLHTHVLPGIDDGPPDDQGAIALADIAVLVGTRVMVATPHLRADHPLVVPEELAPRAAALSEVLADRGLPLEVLPGAEVDLDAAEELSTERLRQATLAGNGRDLLVETPEHELAGDFEGRLRALQDRGFRIVLAHPERNPTLQRKPQRLGQLVRAGMLVQLTARAVAYPQSPESALAFLALRKGWAHVIATDAHDDDARAPDLTGATHRGVKVMPGAGAQLEWMISAAPLALVGGRDLPPQPKPRSRLAWRRQP